MLMLGDSVGINHDVAHANLDINTSFNFDNSPGRPFRYAETFLFVILPYGAFHQINYVSRSTKIFFGYDNDKIK